MRKIDIELLVGVFVVLGILALGYISVNLGELEVLGKRGYTVYAEFDRTGGLKPGATVEIAGVKVGRVKEIHLSEDYTAVVALEIDRNVKLQEDAIVSIKTKGLIGEKYIEITPGGSERLLADGDRLRETESAVDLEELISKFVFGKVEGEGGK
ncbi:MAG TPA: outer membrane lipid asymmetry maintenance protein MlaD [Nitrospirae bacterium]|nr:outer membrane lipid asymmetry maintenance protein MlaD [Nitrospirota bacterium]